MGLNGFSAFQCFRTPLTQIPFRLFLLLLRLPRGTGDEVGITLEGAVQLCFDLLQLSLADALFSGHAAVHDLPDVVLGLVVEEIQQFFAGVALHLLADIPLAILCMTCTS